jgi:plasmid stabilization system protein ParE
MLQFEISESAEDELLHLIEYYGRVKATRIAEAYNSVRADLPTFPDVVPVGADGRTRVLHRAAVLWVYEVLPDRIRLLRVLDPRQDQPR